MKKIRVGILGAADVAYRRFLPALSKVKCFEFVGVAIADYKERGEDYNKEFYDILLKEKKEKAQKFINSFGGNIYIGYEAFLCSNLMDVVYIPLPPSLHYFWSRKALLLGKHVLVEKPCTTTLNETKELIRLARNKGLVINENYSFIMHKQMNVIKDILDNNEIGEIRLIRAVFGFPHRSDEDFRYKKEMGGGALLDCGGHVLKVIQQFLGDDIRVLSSVLHRSLKHNVDLYGSAVLIDKNNVEAQVAFGMDNSYKCELEIWGSKGIIYVPRVFTAPADLETKIFVRGETENVIVVGADDQFKHAIECLYECIYDGDKKELVEEEILIQSKLMAQIRDKSVGLE